MGIFADARRKSQAEADKKRAADDAREQVAIATAQALVIDLKADFGDMVRPTLDGSTIKVKGTKRALSIVCHDGDSFTLFQRSLDSSQEEDMTKPWEPIFTKTPINKEEMTRLVDDWLTSHSRI